MRMLTNTAWGVSNKEELERMFKSIEIIKSNGLMSRRNCKGSGFIGCRIRGSLTKYMPRRPDTGMTLVEVMIALLVLSIVLVPTTYLIDSLFNTSAAEQMRSTASAITTSQVSCLQSLPTYPTSSQANPEFPAVSIGASSVNLSSGSTVSSGSVNETSVPTGCQGTNGGTGTGGSSTTKVGRLSYSITNSINLVSDTSTSSSMSSLTTPSASALESACYGFPTDSQLILQANSTVKWPENGSSQATTQSLLVIPPEVDVLVENPDTGNSPLSGATVSISDGGSGPIETTGIPSSVTTATTNASGCAEFVNFPPATYTISATFTLSDGTQITDSKSVDVTAGQMQTLTLHLSAPPPPCTDCSASSPPQVDAIAAPPWDPTPASSVMGPWAGGDTVVLCGSNFTNAEQVDFTDGSITTTAQFTVVPTSQQSPAGTVSFPSMTGVGGGTVSVACGSGYQVIEATVPAAPVQGSSTSVITVVNSAGSSCTASCNSPNPPNAVQFDYTTTPFVTAITVSTPGASEPNATENPTGTPYGGTNLTLEGFNFIGATHVTFCIYLQVTISNTNYSAPCSTVEFSPTASSEGTGPVHVGFTVVNDFEIVTAAPLDLTCPSGWNFVECATLAYDLASGSSIDNYAAIWVTDEVTTNGQTYYERSNPYDSNECQDGGGSYPQSSVTVQSVQGPQPLYCHFQYVFPPTVNALWQATGSNLLGTVYGPKDGGTIGGGNTVYLCPGNNLDDSGFPGQLTTAAFEWTNSSGQPVYQGIPTSDWSEQWQGPDWNVLDPDGAPCGDTLLGYGYVQMTMPPASILPSGAPDTVCITVQNEVGEWSPCNADNSGTYKTGTYYTYSYTPVITGISPSGGPVGGGQTVTITGTHLNGVTTVNFGCATGSNISVNSAGTSLTVTTPAASYTAAGVCTTLNDGPEQVTVTVTNPVGTSNGVTYTYANTPSISSINPDGGPIAGGNTIAICGSNLQYITSASFGGSTTNNVSLQWQGTSFSGPCGGTVTGYNYLNVVVPGSPNGTYDQVGVTITNVAGMTSNNYWSYTFANAPVISSISPPGGPVSGGTTVTIYGEYFQGVTSVDFGCAGGSIISINSNGTVMTVTSPASSFTTAGVCGNDFGLDEPVQQVTVTASNPAGSGSYNYFTYANTPLISSINPDSGPIAGGNTIAICGSNLQYITSASFGGSTTNNVSLQWQGTSLSGPCGGTVTGYNYLNVVVPGSPNGTYDQVGVTITNAAGMTSNNYWSYTYEGSPSISSISPTSVNYCNFPGTATINIYGNNFTGATSVTIGGSSVSFTVDSNTEITATDQWDQEYSGQVDVSTSVGTAYGPNFNYSVSFCL